MRILSVLAVLFVCAAPVAALYMEHTREEFGPAPAVGKPSDKRYLLAYGPGRCYLRSKMWSGWGIDHVEEFSAFQGNAERVNEAIAGFAALPIADKEIRLFPGPGSVRSLKDLVVSCDWHIHWSSHHMFPRGERKQETETLAAVLTIFVNRVAPIPAADPRTGEWIKELDDARFVVRQRAFRALAEQADAAAPALRQALATANTVEHKMRIEQLLRRLDSIHVAHLKLPKGVPVRGLDDLMKRARDDWKSGDLGKSWEAAQNTSAWAEYTQESLPILVEMLQEERVQVRELALGAFTRLGKRAEETLPALRAAGATSPPALATVIRQAAQLVHNPTPAGVVDEDWQRNRALRQGIQNVCDGIR